MQDPFGGIEISELSKYFYNFHKYFEQTQKRFKRPCVWSHETVPPHFWSRRKLSTRSCHEKSNNFQSLRTPKKETTFSSFFDWKFVLRKKSFTGVTVEI